MKYYLLQWEYEGEKGRPLVCDQRELRNELGRNIETHHYSGDGNSIAYLGRWDDNKVTMLVQEPLSEERGENDYLYWNYRVADMDGNKEFTFTVRIDGRS